MDFGTASVTRALFKAARDPDRRHIGLSWPWSQCGHRDFLSDDDLSRWLHQKLLLRGILPLGGSR